MSGFVRVGLGLIQRGLELVRGGIGLDGGISEFVTLSYGRLGLVRIGLRFIRVSKG